MHAQTIQWNRDQNIKNFVLDYIWTFKPIKFQNWSDEGDVNVAWDVQAAIGGKMIQVHSTPQISH